VESHVRGRRSACRLDFLSPVVGHNVQRTCIFMAYALR
jgi:hypothetical protein